METTIKLNLPEDIMNLCTIYNIPPETIVQSFVDSVSFPSYYTKANTKHRWATLFFLHYIQIGGQDWETNYALEDQYLQRFTDTMIKNDVLYNNSGMEAGREVMKEWQNAVLADRDTVAMNYSKTFISNSQIS